MILKNGFVLDKSFRFVKTDLVVDGDKIVHVGNCDCDTDVLDCTGKYIIPGLVDIHTHGCGGADACDATKEAMDIMSETQGKAGITSFCATSMTVPEEQLNRIFKTIGDYMKGKQKGAHVIGINMEGPFFNMKKKGAQRGDCLLNPDVDFFRKLNKKSGNAVKLVDLAPELDGSIEFIKAVKDEVTVSIGHTATDYKIAMDAIHAGASHVTHLYNAMDGFTHRAPGLVGAAADTNVTTELISDGIHIDPTVVRATFKLMNDRVVLISDSMSACGMPNGEYELGGQKVFVKDKKATLEDGTIAGSSTNLFDCMRKAVEFGIPLETAVKAASFNPAKAIGMEKKIGVLDVNRDADIVVMDKDLVIEKIIIKGEVQ
ncbi:N-acetylglucosamine-6-phosphate deacetylase [Paludicola sp. MB14-C6]|uniref:N-acetylglucosamine-6-phosphate deacetylase n=1 Tax=Paludihabitans sp. MB14-C6 TaxID=3070656 RepID=UPI0027DD020B|nr:N-acetylglucosamine-6-phosphate deacetylase [Paludicola sp. MB14-C6]WMJ24140.1 N-acetylglucosamine-6-phosphate deacetylase [Paludicola sp. MB14-C6]